MTKKSTMKATKNKCSCDGYKGQEVKDCITNGKLIPFDYKLIKIEIPNSVIEKPRLKFIKV